MKVDVKQGKFIITDIWVTAEGDGFLALEADCQSKYPDWGGTAGRTIFVIPGEGALHLDDGTDEMTSVTLPEEYKGWEVMMEGGRYSLRIVAWKNQDIDGEQVYRREP